MKGKNITIILSIIGVVVFIVAVISVSYAYYTSNVTTPGEATTEVKTATISAEFNGGDDLNFTNMIPGDSFSKTFSVKNTGTTTIYYKITMKDITNTFARTQDITYKLTENGTEIASGTFPSTTSRALSDKLSIDGGVTNDYTLTVTYVNDSNENQIEDMDKELGGSIFIEEVDK